MNSNAIKEESLLNYYIQYRRASILFLISITLVFSPAYLLPLAYSQELSYVSTEGRSGIEETDLSLPAGITVDSSSGNVYVADTANNRIQVFSSNGTFISIWGRYGERNGTFSHPQGVAIDQEGNVYVADTDNHRIQVFSSNGTFISTWGRYGIDEIGMRFPEGVAIDQEGNVYVADTANHRISAFTFSSPTGDEAFSSED
jgi:tripartite motif-containing protein 71